jgi:hypothetical protein
MGRMQVITSSLSLARELWRRGEPGLADAALQLSPDQIADVGAAPVSSTPPERPIGYGRAARRRKPCS